MATKATGFPALVYRTSSLFEGRPHSRILQFLRPVVLFLVLLDGFEEWFKIPAGSLSSNRHVISCILFSLEQSRVVDFTVAEHHPDSILESNVQNFEFSRILLRRMNDFPRPFFAELVDLLRLLEVLKEGFFVRPDSQGNFDPLRWSQDVLSSCSC